MVIALANVDLHASVRSADGASFKDERPFGIDERKVVW